MEEVMKHRFSLFAPGINTPKGQRPYKQGTFMDVYQWMNSTKLMLLTQQLRGIKDEKEQKAFKASRLPFVTFSGMFDYRRQEGLIQHSELQCFDFDHLGGRENLWRVRQQLENDPYLETMLMFTSPRGDGVKWVTKIDLTRGPHENGTWRYAHISRRHTVCRQTRLQPMWLRLVSCAGMQVW